MDSTRRMTKEESKAYTSRRNFIDSVEDAIRNNKSIILLGALDKSIVEEYKDKGVFFIRLPFLTYVYINRKKVSEYIVTAEAEAIVKMMKGKVDGTYGMDNYAGLNLTEDIIEKVKELNPRINISASFDCVMLASR